MPLFSLCLYLSKYDQRAASAFYRVILRSSVIRLLTRRACREFNDVAVETKSTRNAHQGTKFLSRAQDERN